MASLVSRDTSGVLSAGEGEVELVGRRTRTAKVFHLGGRRYRVGASAGPIHYRLDPFGRDPFEEIDLDVRLTPEAEWDAACETNGYQVRLWQSRVVGDRTLRYIAQFRRAGRWLAMAPVVLVYENDAGEKQVISTVQAVGAPSIDNEQRNVTWADAFGEGIDFAYNLRPDRFFKTLIIRNAQALPRPTIRTAGLRLTLVMALAWEAEAANGFAAGHNPVELSDDVTGIDTADEVTQDVDFSFKDALSREVWWLHRPMAWDSVEEEPQSIEVGWSLRRAGSRVFATFSVPTSAFTKAVYPIYIDTAIGEEQVRADSDDAYEYGTTYPGSGALRLNDNYNRAGASVAVFFCAGMRFTTIPIPSGATVDSAAISVCGYYSSDTRPIDWYVACEDVDDGATWSAGHTPTNAYSGRTSARARWIESDPWSALTWYDSPSLVGPVGEVVARAGWSDGNDLNFVVYNASTSLGDGFRHWLSYDYQPANSPKFNCTYTEPAGFDGLLLGGD